MFDYSDWVSVNVDVVSMRILIYEEFRQKLLVIIHLRCFATCGANQQKLRKRCRSRAKPRNLQNPGMRILICTVQKHEEQPLARRAKQNFEPRAHSAAHKRRVSDDHLVDQDTERPPVNGLSVPYVSIDPNESTFPPGLFEFFPSLISIFFFSIERELFLN